MKTIGHILPFPAVGGTEHGTARIARAASRTRFKSIAFCLPEAETVRALFHDIGVSTVSYSPPTPSYRRGVAYLRSSLKLARDFKDHGIDLIHCADLLAAYHATLAGRLAGIPVVSHIRSRFDAISARDRSFLWPVKRFVFVSQNTREHFGYRAARKGGIVIYDGIDVAAECGSGPNSVRTELGIPKDAPVVGMVARVAPQKDFTTLAKAAVRILQVHPTTRFLIVGDNTRPGNREHYAAVVKMLEQYGVAESFIFTGERLDVVPVLDAIDIFVLSTHREGLPLVLLEAMARHRPVVATCVDGVPELVHDGETGLLVAHENDGQLAQHVVDLIQSPARASELGAAGHAFVQARFNTAQFASNINSLYSDVLGLPSK
jgi:glycosyltransferase involved in cell wall biosynthesis